MTMWEAARCATAWLVVTAATMSPAFAQTFGVKAGLTRSTITFEDAPLEAAPKIGLLAGGVVNVGLAGRLRLQVEALFADRRVDFEDVVHDRLRYVEVPVVARYRLFERGAVRVHAEGGAALAILIDATEEVFDASTDITETMQPTDVALAAGVAVDWGSRWTFGARYLHGLTDVYAAPEFPARQRALQVAVEFRIH